MADLELWREFSAAAWGKLEERRLRIEALERQIAAADKLAEEVGGVVIVMERVDIALAAYEATKEQSDE